MRNTKNKFDWLIRPVVWPILWVRCMSLRTYQVAHKSLKMHNNNQTIITIVCVQMCLFVAVLSQ